MQLVNAILIECIKELTDTSLEKEYSRAGGNVVDLGTSGHGFEFYLACYSFVTSG